MKLRFHRLVQSDVDDAMIYYERVGNRMLVEDFYDEVIAFANTAAALPTKFHPISSRFRRANLKRFPYHLLYEIRRDYVFVTVVKHHSRRPSFGTRRA